MKRLSLFRKEQGVPTNNCFPGRLFTLLTLSDQASKVIGQLTGTLDLHPFSHEGTICLVQSTTAAAQQPDHDLVKRDFAGVTSCSRMD